MTISSKPDDSDEIIEIRVDALGNKRFVPSRLLITFFDDLVNSIVPSTPSEQIDSAQESIIGSLKKSLSDNVNSLESRIDSIKAVSNRRSSDEDTKRLVYLLISDVGSIKKSIEDINQKLSNLEQVTWP